MLRPGKENLTLNALQAKHKPNLDMASKAEGTRRQLETVRKKKMMERERKSVEAEEEAAMESELALFEVNQCFEQLERQLRNTWRQAVRTLLQHK
jgi:hypothetical protein